MAKQKGNNKLTYRPLKNSNMIDKGEKQTIKQILDKGSQAKPQDKTHVQNVKEQQEKAKVQTKTETMIERKKELDKKRSPENSPNPPRKEGPTKSRD